MPDFIATFVERERGRIAESLLNESGEASLLRRFLDHLEEEHAAFQNTELSAREAASESGYSQQAIRILRHSGTISHRRADLPRKPGHGIAKGPKRTNDGTPSISDRVLGRGGRRKLG